MAVTTKRKRRSTRTASSQRVSKRRAVEAIFEAEGLPGWLGWGTMGAESTWGSTSSGHYFGLIKPSYSGQVPNDNWQHDAQISAHLYKQLVGQYGSVAAAVPHYSGNSYTVSHVEDLGKPQSAGKTQGMELVGLGEDLLGGGTGGSVLENFINPLHLQPFGSEGPSAEGLETIPGSGDHTLNPFEPLEQAGSAIVAVASMITDVHFWIRVGEAVGALILIYMGLHSLTGQGPTPTGIVQTAAATKGL